jgi:hypothetical protein
MTDSTKTRRRRAAAKKSENETGKTGPHMVPPAIGDRFPTGAGGHPVPDIGEPGEEHREVHLHTGRPTGGTRLTPEEAEKGEGQARVPGENPPDPDESQIERGSVMTDVADAAQNERPGTPPNVTIDPRKAQEEPRRREFEHAVAEDEGEAKKG